MVGCNKVSDEVLIETMQSSSRWGRRGGKEREREREREECLVC